MAPLFEFNQENAFPVLGNNGASIDDLWVNLIAKRLLQRIADDLERSALIVTNQVLHVLQDECVRLVVIQYFSDGEKEVALLLIFKTVFASQAELFVNTRKAERLTGEAAAQNVELRNICDCNGVDSQRLPKLRLFPSPTGQGQTPLMTGYLLKRILGSTVSKPSHFRITCNQLHSSRLQNRLTASQMLNFITC